MSEGLFALAFGAGILAAVNPCGFALLPAYVSLLVIGEGDPRRPVPRAVLLTAAMALGFSAVFAVFGLLIWPVAAGAQRYLPWFTVALGLMLIGVGGWLLRGREIALPRRRGGSRRQVTGSFWSMAGFGATYATASLTCTIAPFLAVVISSFRSSSALLGIGLFLTYAAGMATVVGALAVAVALAEQRVVTRMRRASRWVPRVSGLLLLLTGAYVAYYGWWEMQVLGGAEATDPVIDTAAAIQRTLANAVGSVGIGGWLVVLFALVAVVAASLVIGRTGRTTESARQGSEDRGNG